MVVRRVRKKSNGVPTLHLRKKDFGFFTKTIGDIQIDIISQRIRSLGNTEGLQGQHCPAARMVCLCAWEKKV